jgi:RIP metalloprotease RseP
MSGWIVAVLFIVSILLVVMIHESGHFFAAKSFGIKVTEYFVGFGPRLWSTRRGETEYGFKALPFGGYVRIAGMNPYEEIAAEDLPRTYGAKPSWQRALVILAGPFTHFALAAVLLAGYFAIVGARTEARPEIASVEPSMVTLAPPASGTGVEAGDQVVSVDGKNFADEAAFVAYMDAHAGQEVELTVRRGDPAQEVTVAAVPAVEPTPAATAGLQAGDEILKVDGRAVGSVDGFVESTRAHTGDPVEIEYERDGETRTTSATPVMSAAASTAGTYVFPRLGVSLQGARDRVGPLTAIGRGVTQTGVAVKAVVVRLGDVFGPAGIRRIGSLLFGSEQRGQDDVVSVIGGVRLAKQAGDAGAWDQVFELFIVFNVFVGVLNLIPLPPLDGGHLAVLGLEKLFRRPIDARKLVPVTAVVAGFMVLFAVSVVYLDLVKPVPNLFP